MATWTEPKTDWVSTDKFNIEDYNRIKNNLEYLYDFAVELTGYFSIGDMGDDIETYEPYWTAEQFNLFETNLETINKSVFSDDLGDTQTFYRNGVFIKSDELNRIESATIEILADLERWKSSIRRLPFRLGAYRALRI